MATTGLGGPDPQQGQLVDTVWVGLVDGVVTSQHLRLAGDPGMSAPAPDTADHLEGHRGREGAIAATVQIPRGASSCGLARQIGLAL